METHDARFDCKCGRQRFRHFSILLAYTLWVVGLRLSREQSCHPILLMAAGEAQGESEVRRGGEALMANRVRPLSPQTARSLVESIDAFIFDCDGLFFTSSLRFLALPSPSGF